MNNKQKKDMEYFIQWVENFFTLSEEEKKEMIEQTNDERFQAYLKRISVLNEEEQAEELEYLKYGD